MGQAPEPIRFFASLVCHQESLRTFHCLGAAMPLCSRCTGFYAGFLLSSVLQFLFSRGRSLSLPGRCAAAFAMLLLAIFAADGVASSLGLWDTGISGRFRVGLAAGAATGVFLIPLFWRYAARRQPEGNRLSPAGLAFLLAGVILPALLPVERWPAVFLCWSWAGALGLLALYGALNLTLAGLILTASRRVFGWGQTVVLAALLWAGEIFLFLAVGLLRRN